MLCVFFWSIIWLSVLRWFVSFVIKIIFVGFVLFDNVVLSVSNLGILWLSVKSD